MTSFKASPFTPFSPLHIIIPLIEPVCYFIHRNLIGSRIMAPLFGFYTRGPLYTIDQTIWPLSLYYLFWVMIQIAFLIWIKIMKLYVIYVKRLYIFHIKWLLWIMMLMGYDISSTGPNSLHRASLFRVLGPWWDLGLMFSPDG